MDRYIYLLLSLYLFCIWLALFLSRRDLRRKIMRASAAGAFAGLLCEIWYFKDYWRPPSLLGIATISVEDVLFGFAITGIAVSIYDVAFKRENVREFRARKRLFLVFFGIGAVSVLVFNNWLGFNSYLVSSFTCIILSMVMVAIRKDLLAPAVVSGALCVAVFIPIYVILLNWLSPAYFDNYFLLHNTRLGITVLGNVAVTEIIWYFAWGCLAGVLYDFASGGRKVPKQPSQATG